MIFVWLRNRRRKKLLNAAWPVEWTESLRNNVRQYRLFEQALLSQRIEEAVFDKLHACTKIMVAEKSWSGLDGMAVTDEMKVTIAAQAALLLLGVEGYYFDHIKSIAVAPYPVRRQMHDGLVVHEQSGFSGMATQDGLVILSWPDVIAGSRSSGDARNVVIHEFAHCLDGIDGRMAGDLMFEDRETTARWNAVVAKELGDLRDDLEFGRQTLFDGYGATNEAEFFAVASETFFEQPRRMRQGHAELFDLMVKYFRIDPTDW